MMEAVAVLVIWIVAAFHAIKILTADWQATFGATERLPLLVVGMCWVLGPIAFVGALFIWALGKVA